MTCRVCLGEGKNTVNGVVETCRYCHGTGKRSPAEGRRDRQLRQTVERLVEGDLAK